MNKTLIDKLARLNLLVLPDLQINVKVARVFSGKSSVFDRQGKKKNGINLATLVLN